MKNKKKNVSTFYKEKCLILSLLGGRVVHPPAEFLG